MVSAVEWSKDEYLRANRLSMPSSSSSSSTIFTSSTTLQNLSPLLFPNLTGLFQPIDHRLDGKDREGKGSQVAAVFTAESWFDFLGHLPFYLASLNLYFFFLSAKGLALSSDIPNSLCTSSSSSFYYPNSLSQDEVDHHGQQPQDQQQSEKKESVEKRFIEPLRLALSVGQKFNSIKQRQVVGHRGGSLNETSVEKEEEEEGKDGYILYFDNDDTKNNNHDNHHGGDLQGKGKEIRSPLGKEASSSSSLFLPPPNMADIFSLEAVLSRIDEVGVSLGHP